VIISVVTAPTVEPVTLSEVKAHLRIDHLDHDTQLTSLIQASREHMERVLGRALVQQTRSVKYKQWPESDRFALPYPPIQSVSSLKYTDTGGTTSTFSSDNYTVITDREPGELVLGYSKTWPTATIHYPEYPIEIEYVCGYAPNDDSPPDYRANVPAALKNAIKLDIELRYDRPPADYAEQLRNVIEALTAPYRVWSF
jgi:uncharacterized phiE125 gp8 family phage protein